MPVGLSNVKYTLQSVENALDLLEALGEEEEDIRIVNLSQRLSLDKTRIFRLLATFEKRGYVEKVKSGKYRLSSSAFEMAQKLLSRPALLRKARPVMECLAWKCNEAVYLCIRKRNEVLLLDMFDTMDRVKVVSLTGKRFPLRRCAAGMVLLEETELAALQPEAELSVSRCDDHARDLNALGDGITSLAVPLKSGGGTLCGSLCLLGPSYRLSPERIERELLPLLREAGIVISSKLGYFSRPGDGNNSLAVSPQQDIFRDHDQRRKRDSSAIIL